MRRATPIHAPIDGTVIARKIGPGQYLRNDTGEALYTIADLSTMWLKAQVPEKEIPSVQLGQEVEVKVSALPDRVFKARVTAINAGTDATTRRIDRAFQARTGPSIRLRSRTPGFHAA